MAQLIFILLGPQGAGKGTQAEYLTDHFGIQSLSIGQALRAEAASGSDLGKRVQTFLDAGKLVPQEVTDEMILAALKKPEFAKGIILDGYPRNAAQAASLDRVAKVSALIAIDISDAEAINRLSHRLVCKTCGRSYNEITRPPVVPGVCDKDGGVLEKRKDDMPDAIRERLKTYHADTAPLIDYYAKQGIVARVQGEQPIVEVHEDIVAELKTCCSIEKQK